MTGLLELDDVPDRSRRKRAAILPGSVLDELITELLGLTDVPLGAYPIAERLRASSRYGNMMAIYRSLDRLCKRGIVERVESLSAFRLRTASRVVLMACERCGTTTTLPVHREFDGIEGVVREGGFVLTKLAIEAVGICASCRVA